MLRHGESLIVGLWSLFHLYTSCSKAAPLVKVCEIGPMATLNLGKYILIFDFKVKVGFVIPIDPK